MSAFMVEDASINNIVAYAWSHPELNNKLVEGQTQESLGNDLFRMNVAAVNASYGAGEAATFRPLDYQYHNVMPPERIQVLKSMRCLLYQCCEGDIPETWPLYQALRLYSLALAYDIVSDSPEYDAAKWE